MKEGHETIYNFSEEKKTGELADELIRAITEWEKIGLIVDEITIKFTEKTTYQSNPKEGNLERK